MATEEELADILGALEDDDEWNQASGSGAAGTSSVHNISASSDEDFSDKAPKVTVFESGMHNYIILFHINCLINTCS